MNQPFIIYGLPRSRTAWLSVFLSYGETQCFHEIAMCMRGVDDIKEFFARNNIGSCETAAVQGRPLLKHLVPELKEVVVLRPVAEVVGSILAMAVPDVVYDKDILVRNMAYGDRLLRKAAEDASVLTIQYDDLASEDTCRKVFEHCLPYEFDKTWWESLKGDNIQANVEGVLRYYHDNREDIELFKKTCKSELRRLSYEGVIRKRAGM